jgi:hypothetical protein
MIAPENDEKWRVPFEAIIRKDFLKTSLTIRPVGETFAEYFVKHSQGYGTVQEVVLYLDEDLHCNYKSLGLLGKGFGNLGALRVLTMCFLPSMDPEPPNQGGESLDQARVREAATSLYWEAVTGILRRIPNRIELRLHGNSLGGINESNFTKIAVTIQGVSTVGTFLPVVLSSSIQLTLSCPPW